MSRVPPKNYALKLGKSFDKRSEVSYHTMRFDFKPVSLAASKDLTMQIGGENGLQVTATMTGKQGGTGNGTTQNAQTVYKGSKKPYTTKECVLIVDEVTGEVTLERLGDNVMLKKARPEGSTKAHGNGNGHGRPASATTSSQSSDNIDVDSTTFSTPEYSPATTTNISPTPSPSLPVNQQTARKGSDAALSSKDTAAVAVSRPPAKSSSQPSKIQKVATPSARKQPTNVKSDEFIEDVFGKISESSSSSSSDSDSSSSDDEDMDTTPAHTATVTTPQKLPQLDQKPTKTVDSSNAVASLKNDLQLSDDSDSEDNWLEF